MKVKEAGEKAGLKLNTEKLRSWHLVPSLHGKKKNRETMETVTDFIFLGSQITADGDCSYEIKSRLVPGKNNYDQPRQHIKK